MLSKSQNHNENYLAKVVQLKNPIKHPNADRLQGWIIDGCTIWTDMSRKEGDIGIFFPIECKIHPLVLRRLNLYEDKSLNKDESKKGFFNNKGRVRAIKLRGEPSMGFFLTTEELFEGVNLDPENLTIGEEFDTIGKGDDAIIIVEKYIPKTGTPRSLTPKESKANKKLKRISRLIEGQFRFHEDTANLRKNMHRLNILDMVSITNKLHGTSFVVGNIQVKKKQNWLERVLTKWGWITPKLSEYDYVYSSRKVVKNEFAVNKGAQHYYSHNIWADIKDVLQPSIEKGITLYGEAVGYDRSGKMIQKGYDYGYRAPGDPMVDPYTEGVHYGIYIYKITFTNEDGVAYRFTWQQVKDYCLHYGIKHVPEFYYGRLSKQIDVRTVMSDRLRKFRDEPTSDTKWTDDVLQAWSERFLEKDCTLCTTGVPAEGIVIAQDKLQDPYVFKLKSFRFLQIETEELDAGEIDMETEQTIEDGHESN